MNTQKINIDLPEDLAKDFKKSVPARSRSKFITEALKEKLSKKRNSSNEWEESLKANKKFYKQVAEEWKVTEVEGWPK